MYTVPCTFLQTRSYALAIDILGDYTNCMGLGF